MTWTLTQNGSTVTGPARVLLPTGIVLLNGALTGTLSGTAFAYTITVSPGGVPTQPGCTGQLAGNTVASIGTTSTMAGDYTVTSSTCPTPLSAGTFTLTKSS